MTTEIKCRNFAALHFPKGSLNRKILNCDSLTSEYFHSLKYILYVHHPETEKYCAYKVHHNFRTLREAREKEQELLKLHP